MVVTRTPGRPVTHARKRRRLKSAESVSQHPVCDYPRYFNETVRRVTSYIIADISALQLVCVDGMEQFFFLSGLTTINIA